MVAENGVMFCPEWTCATVSSPEFFLHAVLLLALLSLRFPTLFYFFLVFV